MKCIQISMQNKAEINLFLNFPDELYKNTFKTHDKKTELKILTSSHILSGQFEVFPYIVLDDNKVMSRAVLTVYQNDDTAFVGFFESRDYFDATKLLFESIFKKAQSLNIKTLLGPVDGSIWIKYRFKTDHFENYYTGEPYNLPYYKTFWENCGFEISDRYYSNIIKVPTAKDNLEKFEYRLKTALEKGYVIKNSSFKTYKNDLKAVYLLLINAYSKFPGFKKISEEQFISLFYGLRHILVWDIVFLAYKDDKPAGFFVSIPNLGDLPYNLSFMNIIKLPFKKRNCKDFVLLYMGIGKEHLGLGGALAQTTKNYLQNHKSTGVSALIHERNFSGSFYKNLTVDTSEYVLLKKHL